MMGQHDRSEALFYGSYGLHATGTTPSGDFAAVGRFTFDGKGNLTGKLFVRVAGKRTSSLLAFTGTYSVSPDCTVTDNWARPSMHARVGDRRSGQGVFHPEH